MLGKYDTNISQMKKIPKRPVQNSREFEGEIQSVGDEHLDVLHEALVGKQGVEGGGARRCRHQKNVFAVENSAGFVVREPVEPKKRNVWSVPMVW